MKYLSLLLAIIFSINCWAQDVVYIEKGTPAPYSGQLFTNKKALEIRKQLIERDQFKLFNEALTQNVDLQQKIIINQKDQVNLLLDQNTKLVSRVENNGSLTNFERMFWFGIGVVSSGLAVWGASRLVR